jgi:hypothetical protein
MTRFQRPEHQAVAAVLAAMDHDLLTRCGCWFGGGTEIVLDLGEYRISKDIDFLCADAAGYRELRTRIVSAGAAALFGPAIRQERAFRTDQYGIRGIVSAAGIPIRFEIVREARIDLTGQADPLLGVPRLSDVDRVAEKLLANADRTQDRSTAYRDAVDLGMLALRLGPFPDRSREKAEAAYGTDIALKLRWVLDRLADAGERHYAATTLGMDPGLLDAAIAALRTEAQRFSAV